MDKFFLTIHLKTNQSLSIELRKSKNKLFLFMQNFYGKVRIFKIFTKIRHLYLKN